MNEKLKKRNLDKKTRGLGTLQEWIRYSPVGLQLKSKRHKSRWLIEVTSSIKYRIQVWSGREDRKMLQTFGNFSSTRKQVCVNNARRTR
jgi:hypothetical protein